jgi:hypothetical protein
LGPLLDYLATPGPMTPAGSAAIADRLVLRALFWHWGSRMRRIFASDSLRDTLWSVIDTLKNNDRSAGTIDPPPETSPEDRDFFRSMRDLIVQRREDGSIPLTPPSPFVPLLEIVRSSDLAPDETIALLTLHPWDVDGDEVKAARAWFDREFRFVSLQPKTGFTQSGGQNRGWRTNGYIAEGLADLIDLELEVDSVDLEFGRLAVLGPTAPIDDTDPRFQPIDAAEQTTPGSRKRAGFVTSVRLNSLEVSGNLITTPARTAAVAALALLAPHEVIRLWSHTDFTVDIGGLSADLIVYLEQERLSPAGPTLKVWITNVAAATLDVSGSFLSPSVLLTAVITPIVNELLDHFSPALVDRVSREFFTALDAFLGFVEEGIASFFDVTLPPRPPRNTPSFEQTVQQAVTKGFTAAQNMRLQPVLNLNHEDLFELRTRDVNRTQDEWNTAFLRQDELWTEHNEAAAEAGVVVPETGFNPRFRPRPITNSSGAELTADQIALLQTTYDAWNAQRSVVTEIETRLRATRERLDDLRNNWPEGPTACEIVNEISGYRIGLAICRLDVGPGARALVFPPVGVSQTGDLTLLLSGVTFGQMTAGTRFGYRGDVRNTDGSPAVLQQLPTIDWWQDAQEPALLGPRPTDLRDGPPQIPPGPNTGGIPDWRAYWSIIDVGGPTAQLVRVFNPAPDQHIAEIPIVVILSVGVTTYTAVNVERCGPDLTRLAGELERPPLDDPGRFRPPVGPGGPRPRTDQPIGVDIEVGFRRVPNALEPTIVTAATLEQARVRFGGGNASGSGDLLDIEGALFSRLGFGGGFAGDAHCRVITAWDVKAREEWVNARFELRLPVFVGFGNFGPTDSTHLPGANLLGARAYLPILTYRFGTDPISTGPFTLQAAGPLAGLAQGENRGWIENLMANHALALVKNSPDQHRMREDNPLRYAYGLRPNLVLDPENFEPYVILAMHPSHWSGAVPRDLRDRNLPNLRFETFGSSDALNLAINLFVGESLLDKLGM